MALSKNITDTRGVTATYRVTVRGSIDQAAGMTWFVMRGFISKAQRDADVNSHVVEKSYTVAINPTAPLPLPASGLYPNVISYLETLALAQADFTGATVVA